MKWQKVLTLSPKAIATYYWIQDYVKTNGKFPRHYDVGVYLGADPDSYYNSRSAGIRMINHLKRAGYVQTLKYSDAKHARGKMMLTDKPLEVFKDRSSPADSLL